MGDGGQSVLRPRAPRAREAEAARRPVVDKVEDRPQRAGRSPSYLCLSACCASPCLAHRPGRPARRPCASSAWAWAWASRAHRSQGVGGAVEAGAGEEPQAAHRHGSHRGHPQGRCCMPLARGAMKRRPRTESDRQGELVECGRQPPVHLLLDGKLVVTSTEVLDEGMAGDDDPGAVVLLESAHETKSCFRRPWSASS